MTRWMTVLVALGALAVRADAAEVPFERLPSSQIAVTVSVDGAAPVRFVVDTGANLSAVDARVWAELGQPADAGRAVSVRGAGGKVEGRLVGPVTIEVGGARAELPLVVVLPLEHLQDEGAPIAGILGKDFLGRHVVELDFGSSTLGLHEPGVTLDVADCAALPTRRLRAGLLGVDLRVGESEVPAVVDLGASVTVLNGAAAALPGVVVGAGEDRLSGADASALVVSPASSELGLGSLDLGPATVTTADLEVFDTLRLRRKPAAILGMDVLSRYRLVIDYRSRILYVGSTVAP
jgi:predicted aspartyl protease